jgi:hypothetical protein
MAGRDRRSIGARLNRVKKGVKSGLLYLALLRENSTVPGLGCQSAACHLRRTRKRGTACRRRPSQRACRRRISYRIPSALLGSCEAFFQRSYLS